MVALGVSEVDALDAYSTTVIAVAERLTPAVASLRAVSRPTIWFAAHHSSQGTKVPMTSAWTAPMPTASGAWPSSSAAIAPNANTSNAWAVFSAPKSRKPSYTNW